MKVCTDSCIFGAWVAEKLKQSHNKRLLDIGTGTGLLSMMIAQKCEAQIDALEIDESAYKQSKENFRASPWSNKLHALHEDAKDHKAPRYDVIISNPPFYEKSLRSSGSGRNLAMHGDELTFTQLHEVTDRLLKNDGDLFILIPYDRLQYFDEIFSENYFIAEQLIIRQTESHAPFRMCLHLRFSETEMIKKEMTIKTDGHYSEEFISLLKDYYLNL